MELEYSIRLNEDNEWYMQTHHFHEDIEILLSLSDAGSLFIEDGLYPLKRGTLVLLKNTCLHKTITDLSGTYSRYVIHFREDILKGISTDQSNLLALFSDSNRCVQLGERDIEKLISLLEQSTEANTGRFGEDLKRNHAFIRLLVEVGLLLQSEESVGSRDSHETAKVMPVIDYIRTHLDGDLSLDRLADRFYVSKYHLSRSFKAATGFNVGDYIINCRIIRAKELLRSGLSVQLAGEQSGFGNNAHFIRTFGKLTGTSPGRYKKKYLQGRK